MKTLLLFAVLLTACGKEEAVATAQVQCNVVHRVLKDQSVGNDFTTCVQWRIGYEIQYVGEDATYLWCREVLIPGAPDCEVAP